MYTGPVTLRMRTKEDTELIVTDFVFNQYEYILVTIQNCNFLKNALDEDDEGKEWAYAADENRVSSWFSINSLSFINITSLNML